MLLSISLQQSECITETKSSQLQNQEILMAICAFILYNQCVVGLKVSLLKDVQHCSTFPGSRSLTESSRKLGYTHRPQIINRF